MTLYLSGTIADEFKVWPLDAPAMTVGRSSRNVIQIADATVSKEHAEIIRRGEHFYLRDLGSRNGTRVNGAEAAEPREIVAGDAVEIGHVMCRVTREAPTQRVRLSEATVISSSVRVRADQVLERRSRAPGESSGKLVHLLAEAGHLLVLPRPLKETCDQILTIVERAIPANRFILLLQESPEAEPVQIAARVHGAGANQPLALSRSILSTVMQENTSVLTGDAASDPRFQGQHSIVAQAVRSAMAVPLFDNQRVLGILYVDSQNVAHSFDEEQLELLTLLANMAAVKITNARLLEAEAASARLAQELATATQIQMGLLPLTMPKVEGYEIDGYLQTCYEVGGDLYDFRFRSDGHLMFLIGDVSGKGMGAALLMSSFLSSARVLYDTCTDPGEFASRLSRVMCQQTDPGHFITGIVGCLHPASGKIDYVNAGHLPVCIVKDGQVREHPSTGIPFGIVEDFPYRTETLQLEPGELLALFSDGIPEAQHGEAFFDEARTYAALSAASRRSTLEQARTGMIQAVEAFVAGSPRADDITLIMIRRHA
jgi:serine phosphatase RsbU (regulator of sigma subunit)